MKDATTEMAVEPKASLSLADKARLGDQPLENYVKATRALVVGMMHDRARQLLRDGGQSDADPVQQHLRGIIKRIGDVETISKAFSVQMLPGAAPTEAARAAAAEELLKAVSALFSLELEARAVQARFAASAMILEYSGTQSRRSQTLTLPVDRYLGDRFKRLQARVKDERFRQLGRSEPLDPAGFLNLLVSLGEANVNALVMMGCPDMAVTGGLAAIVAERKAHGVKR